jgi:hypothetical protein
VNLRGRHVLCAMHRRWRGSGRRLKLGVPAVSDSSVRGAAGGADPRLGEIAISHRKAIGGRKNINVTKQVLVALRGAAENRQQAGIELCTGEGNKEGEALPES